MNIDNPNFEKFLSQTPLDSPLIGDIILVQSHGLKSKGNTLLQRGIRIMNSRQKFVPSHAAVAVTKHGVFLHATGGVGVVFTSVSNLINFQTYKKN